MRHLLWAFAVFVSFSGQCAYAAKLDCSSAAQDVEQFICVHRALSQLDDELAAAYAKAIRQPKYRRTLQAQQRAWLPGRSKDR